MKVSGITIVKNAIRFGYPILEAIQSILPLCDEFIINEGCSDDGTYELLQTIKDPKVRIIREEWAASGEEHVLARQTNHAINECSGDWIFYLQSDEVIHEQDLPYLKKALLKYLNDDNVESLRLRWLHFYGSYYRYRIDHGWYQKQDRIIKNNGQIESYSDAFSFRRKDGQDLKRKTLNTLLYHYGWVQHPDMMNKRKANLASLYVDVQQMTEDEKNQQYDYGDLNRFATYFGSHPAVMKDWVEQHTLSEKDWESIQKSYWWHPSRWGRFRYKTPIRLRKKIES